MDNKAQEDRIFNIDLTEDEVDQCVHSINELCEGFIKDGHSIDDLGVQSYLKLANKLNGVFSKKSRQI